MSAARTYADELLARFTDPARLQRSARTPANPAKPAKDEPSCGLPDDSEVCEELRDTANVDPNSQSFAGVREPGSGSGNEHWRGSSQFSQDSQGQPADNSSSDPERDRARTRRERLQRWGWPLIEAEAMAERLARRDREGDERVSCSDCANYRPGRCVNHKRAGLQSAEVGRDLAAMLQRCPGFSSQHAHARKDE